MHKYVIMGVQGCGKGTQARLLKEKLDLVHISVGDIFRWHMQSHTKLAARVRRIINSGQLVGDDVVEEIVRMRLDMHDWNYGFILDGFPRTTPQAEALDAMLAEMGAPVDAVISFDVPRDELVRRLGGRWICRGCGRSFHEVSNPYDGAPCSATGAECDLYQRDDDRPEAVANRLDVYDSQTAPLIDYYASRGLLRRVDGALPLDEVQAQVVEAIA